MRNNELIKQIYEVCRTAPYHEDSIAEMKHAEGCTSMRQPVEMEAWVRGNLQTEYILDLIQRERPEIALETLEEER